jgi:hypothetical protein
MSQKSSFPQAARSVSQVLKSDTPYTVTGHWPGLPNGVRAGVEWGQATGATLSKPFQSSCQAVSLDVLTIGFGAIFTIEAKLASARYPNLCGCAEYRLYIRGSFTRNGAPVDKTLLDPDSSAERRLKQRSYANDGQSAPMQEDNRIPTPSRQS